MYYACCWTAFFYLSWLHTFLERARGFSKADLVTWSWLPFVLGATANLCGGFTSDFLVKRIGLKWGRRTVGLCGLGASAIFLTAAYVTTDKVWTVVFLGLGYAGSDFMLPAAFAVCLDIGGRHAGAVTGAMNMAGQLGAFSTSVAFGQVVTLTGNYNTPLLPMIGFTLVGAALWLKIDPTRPLIRTEDDPAPRPVAIGT
jgi:MFS transporter, ACS family, glucarate transporter